MRLKQGAMTTMQRAFAQHYADSGNATYAATKAGYKPEAAIVMGGKLTKNPTVMAEVRAQQEYRLGTEGLALAIDTLFDVMRNRSGPAGPRVRASEVVLKHTLGLPEDLTGVEYHEMTPEQLDRAKQALMRTLADRAKPVIEGTASVLD